MTKAESKDDFSFHHLSLHVLRELDGGSAWEGPRRPLANVSRDFLFIFITQEVEREAHGREIEFLQQAVKQMNDYNYNNNKKTLTIGVLLSVVRLTEAQMDV